MTHGLTEDRVAEAESQVQGLEFLPLSGRVLIVSNHVSQFDRITLARALPRRLFFPRAWPGPTEAARAALRISKLEDPAERWRASALRALEQEKAVVVFPEGTPAPDGHLYRGGPEVAALAIAAVSVVLPVAIIPSDGADRVVVGEPMDLSRWALGQHDPRLLQAATDSIMAALVDLSGREYRDVDAGITRLQLERVARRERAAVRKQRAAERAMAKAEASQRAARYAEEEAELARAQLEVQAAHVLEEGRR